MDHDKDGIIGKSDLRFTFDQVGKISSEKELDEMLGEASGPLNFTQLLNLFGTRMSSSGGALDKYLSVFYFFIRLSRIFKTTLLSCFISSAFN